MSVFVLDSENALRALTLAPYPSEDDLQALLAQHPALVEAAGTSSNGQLRLLLVSREGGVAAEAGGGARWSVDHVFIDREGVPTLVEVKRATDTRIRREVVGQVLDYAANSVVYSSAEQLRDRFRQRCRDENRDAEQDIAEFLGADSDPGDFWRSVETNLRAGKVRLMFVADSLPPELRRVIEFLNGQMAPAEVLGLELKQYVGEGVRTLIPSVIGRTEEAIRRKDPTDDRQWTESAFFDELGKRVGPSEVGVARSLLQWGRDSGLGEWWGSGSRTGSFLIRHQRAGKDLYLCFCRTYGRLEIPFGMLRTQDPFQDAGRRLQLLRRLNGIDGVVLDEAAIDRYPSIPLASLARPGAVPELLAVLQWMVDVANASDRGEVDN